MHSTVFTLVKGVVNENYLENFIHTDAEEVYDKIKVCDGVEKETNIFENWKWLLNCYGSFITGEKIDDNYTITINLEKLKEYFRNKNERLKELVDKLDVKSWRFLSNDMILYYMQNTIEDKRGFYIIDGDDKWRETDTFDTWLTVIYAVMEDEKLENITYTIVETFDYHA